MNELAQTLLEHSDYRSLNCADKTDVVSFLNEHYPTNATQMEE